MYTPPPRAAGERNTPVTYAASSDATPVRSTPCSPALPGLRRARAGPQLGGWVTDLFRHALAEGSTKRPGGETILAKLSELMFAEVLRRHIEGLPEDSRGWLSGLRDPHVGEALRLIHGRPTEPWTLDGLAQEVGLSRTAFANRFVRVRGGSADAVRGALAAPACGASH